MLQLLKTGKRILNVDESWIAESNFTRMMWNTPSKPSSIESKPVTPRLALIAAVDSEGEVYFCLNHANTDSDVMKVFFTYLCSSLDSERAGWREDTVVLLDGAKYHTS